MQRRKFDGKTLETAEKEKGSSLCDHVQIERLKEAASVHFQDVGLETWGAVVGEVNHAQVLIL